MAVKSPALYDV